MWRVWWLFRPVYMAVTPFFHFDIDVTKFGFCTKIHSGNAKWKKTDVEIALICHKKFQTKQYRNSRTQNSWRFSILWNYIHFRWKREREIVDCRDSCRHFCHYCYYSLCIFSLFINQRLGLFRDENCTITLIKKRSRSITVLQLFIVFVTSSIK